MIFILNQFYTWRRESVPRKLSGAGQYRSLRGARTLTSQPRPYRGHKQEAFDLSLISHCSAGCFGLGDDVDLPPSPIKQFIQPKTKVDPDKCVGAKVCESCRPKSSTERPVKYIKAVWINYVPGIYMMCTTEPGGLLLTLSNKGTPFSNFKISFCDEDALSQSVTLIENNIEFGIQWIMVRFENGDCMMYRIHNAEVFTEKDCLVQCKPPPKPLASVLTMFTRPSLPVNGWTKKTETELIRIRAEIEEYSRVMWRASRGSGKNKSAVESFLHHMCCCCLLEACCEAGGSGGGADPCICC